MRVSQLAIIGFCFFLVLTTFSAFSSPNMDRKKSELKPINLRVNTFTIDLNPETSTDLSSRSISTLLYSGLLFKDQDGYVHPLLIDRWKKEGNIWHFKLKDGLTFSNNQEITSADVISTFCKRIQPKSQWYWALQSIKHEKISKEENKCTGLRTTDKLNFIIEESVSVPWFLDALSSAAGWIVPAQEKQTGNNFGVKPSSGPYTVEKITPNHSITLKSRVNNQRIIFNFIIDDHLAVGRFFHGELDVLKLNSPFLTKRLLKDKNLKSDGYLLKGHLERIQLAMINRSKLIKDGWSEGQVRSLKEYLKEAISFKSFHRLSPPIIEETSSLFIPDHDQSTSFIVSSLPQKKLIMVSENDYFSDLISRTLPHRIKNVLFEKKALDRSIFRKSIIDRNADIYIDAFEAPVRTNIFWLSFFTPKHPWSIIGNPIPELNSLDISNPRMISLSEEKVNSEGYWIPLFRQRQLIAIKPHVKGILLSSSGQENYIKITQN